MARQATVTVENNFKQGYVTEATGLNFPENACTETFDCIFNVDGTVERRLGFNFENNFSTKTIDRTGAVIQTFLWKNVSGDGDISLMVVQVGGTIYFWDATGAAVSTGAIASNITLSTYLASGAPSPNAVECQFASGDQYLIVTHPYCSPFRVAYDVASQTVTGTAITLQIRDFEGDSADSNAIDTRPTSTLAALDVHHRYNLQNQGWTTTNLTDWDTSQTTMPSNADINYLFKNSSDAFDFTNTQLNKVVTGNTPAPKGHYILTVWDQDRDTASGLSGVTSKDSSYFRPSTCAFFAGRVFYSGLNYLGFNSDIYFTQIIERNEQYGQCYQANDPTTETFADLLPSDGGVIRIKEAGTVFKLFSISGALAIFASNGVWLVTGSTGLGFTANDYTVQKISSFNTISSQSFVDVAGYPAWWNADGIYILTAGEAGTASNPSIKSLSTSSIKSFYETIPLSAKQHACGYFHTVDGIIQWLFKLTDDEDPVDIYAFSYILNYNVFTNAFYIWRIPDSAVTINSIVVLDGTSGFISEANVVDDSANLVIDDSSNQVVAFTSTATASGANPTFKYVTSYLDAGVWKFTFSESNNINFLEWLSYDDVGQDFESTFTTGYKVRGQAIKKFQPTWINLYSDTTEATSYTFQGIWDYALNDGTNRTSSVSTITHSDTDYAFATRRIKVRGHGKALQFKVSSVSGLPFRIVGWSVLDTINALP